MWPLRAIFLNVVLKVNHNESNYFVLGKSNTKKNLLFPHQGQPHCLRPSFLLLYYSEKKSNSLNLFYTIFPVTHLFRFKLKKVIRIYYQKKNVNLLFILYFSFSFLQLLKFLLQYAYLRRPTWVMFVEENVYILNFYWTILSLVCLLSAS